MPCCISAFVSGPSCRLAASSDLLAFGPCLGFDIVTARVQLGSTRVAHYCFPMLAGSLSCGGHARGTRESIGSEVIMDSMFALTLSAPLSSLSPRSPASPASFEVLLAVHGLRAQCPTTLVPSSRARSCGLSRPVPRAGAAQSSSM